MTKFLEFNYISPITNYKFNCLQNKYYLVLINTSKNGFIFIHKIEINTIGNVTEIIRSYFVDKTIEISANNLDKCYEIRLFQHSIKSNILKLLLVGKINLRDLNFNEIINIFLFSPSKVLNCERDILFIDFTSFLEEQFFNYETLDKTNKCILFIKMVNTNKYDVIKPYLFKYDLSNETYVFNRYFNNIMKEIRPNYLLCDNLKYDQLAHLIKYFKKFCNNKSYDNYLNFLNEYYIDVNKYIKSITYANNLYLTKINPLLRKINYSPYLNNMIVSPCDGRVIGFDVKEFLRFIFFNKTYTIDDFMNKKSNMYNGSGFLHRIIPCDYQIINLPYSGYLVEMIFLENNIVVMEFYNTYFIPADVHEREYISVIYGHNINSSRTYPELVIPQAKNHLKFYLIIIGVDTKEKNTFIINNKKINKTDLKNNKIWLEQGEEIGYYTCGGGYSLFLINRKINFEDDIKYYSKLINGSHHDKLIECFIKMNDNVGLIL